MFLLSKVVRTNLFIQYCLTFSRNSHKCIYRFSREAFQFSTKMELVTVF